MIKGDEPEVGGFFVRWSSLDNTAPPALRLTSHLGCLSALTPSDLLSSTLQSYLILQ
jgi:hypothetical protein